MSDSQTPSTDDFSTDARVTAYVLGEMTAAEAQAFEREIGGNSQLQAAVVDTQQVARVLEQQLQAEPAAVLSDQNRAVIEAAATGIDSSSTSRSQSSGVTSSRGSLIALLVTVAAIVTVFVSLGDWLNPEQGVDLASSEAPARELAALPALEGVHEVKEIGTTAETQETHADNVMITNLESSSASSSKLSIPWDAFNRSPSDPSPSGSTDDAAMAPPIAATTPTGEPAEITGRGARGDRQTDPGKDDGSPVANVASGALRGGAVGDESGPQPDPFVKSGGLSSAKHAAPTAEFKNSQSIGKSDVPAVVNSSNESSPVPKFFQEQKPGEHVSGATKSPVAGSPSALLGTGRVPTDRPGFLVEKEAPESGKSVPGDRWESLGKLPESLTQKAEAVRLQDATRRGIQTRAANPVATQPESRDGITSNLMLGGIRLQAPDALQEARGRDATSFGLESKLKYMSVARATGGESYAPIVENEFIRPDGDAALSTFSIDVDTAAYSNVRRFLTHNQLPPTDAVRIEELVNYFSYDYAEPVDGVPFSVHVEANACPWNSRHRLVQIGLQGKTIPASERPPINLVFLIDVSGSMRDANKLPLAKSSLQMLANEMTEDDRIAIVTYAGDAGLKLDSTCGSDRETIRNAISALSAGGSTNGEAGIKLAYETAVRHFQERGNNRVIVCTDGDFNVGNSSDDAMVRLIEDKAKSGVFLSIFGFGTGNLKDSKLEAIADRGNGHYAYVDGHQEAKKLFVEQMTGTLFTIAKDVKIQVEFNPGQVGAYRLIGYENRKMAARDFADDTKDAGEIGAGHHVTALYEVIPRSITTVATKPLKYQRNTEPQPQPVVNGGNETLTVALRYKQPDGQKSSLLEISLVDEYAKAQASDGFEWAAAVATFGMVLRQSKFVGDTSLSKAAELALASKLDDKQGRRREFIELMYRAMVLKARQSGQPVPPFPELSREQADHKASVGGKYNQLLKVFKVEEDREKYGNFADFGAWDGTSYAGETNLPKGYWVYVFPNWYIFGEQVDSTHAGDVADPTVKPDSQPTDESLKE